MTPDDAKRLAEDRIRYTIVGWSELERAVAYQHLNALGQRVGGIEQTIERLARAEAERA